MTDPQAQPAADAPQVIHDPECPRCRARVPDVVCYDTRPLGDESEQRPRRQYYRCRVCLATFKVIRT